MDDEFQTNADEPKPRGAHFAPRSQDADEAVRGAHMAAASHMAAPSRMTAASSSPDETTQFILAAQSQEARRTRRRAPRPDETIAYLTAAESARLGMESGFEGADVPSAPFASDEAVDADDGFGSPDAADQPTGDLPALDDFAPADLEEEETEEEVEQLASRKANGVSLLVIISRITGFGRTMAQANALSGALMAVASCYTVASTMPNFLYELVMGGMLITSFLPVYLSVRKRLGRDGAAAYASNLLSLVLLLMGAMSILCFIFAGPVIWTQSAGASEDFNFDLAVWFFRFFAFEIILYGLSSIISGVLNAERDYFWSNAAPILNNVITIASFLLYAYVVNNGILDWERALIILAIGNPLAVATQVFVQLPALARHGVHLRLRIDLHDPAIKETLAIGLPTLVVTFASFPTSAVQSSCALQCTANGAAISYYSRVWYVLPYSILAIPLSVTMFTELSNYHVAGRLDAYRRAVASGMRKLMFTLIPCAMLLIVFAPCLIAAIGGFDAEDAAMTSMYLRVQSIALPFYALSTYLQKVCSSLMRMKFYAIATCVAAVVQVSFCIVLTPMYGLYVVPFSSTFFFIAVDAVTILHIRKEIGAFGMMEVVASSVRSLAFGLLGSAVGVAILWALTNFMGPVEGSMVRGFVYTAAAGIPALLVTYGSAYVLHKSEAPFFDALFDKAAGLLRRA